MTGTKWVLRQSAEDPSTAPDRPDPAAARFWVVSDILGFVPDPAHILVSVAQGRPDLSADDIRRGLEDLLALTLRGA